MKQSKERKKGKKVLRISILILCITIACFVLYLKALRIIFVWSSDYKVDFIDCPECSGSLFDLGKECYMLVVCMNGKIEEALYVDIAQKRIGLPNSGHLHLFRLFGMEGATVTRDMREGTPWPVDLDVKYEVTEDRIELFINGVAVNRKEDGLAEYIESKPYCRKKIILSK